MKISISTNTLSNALTLVAASINARSSLPILSNVCILVDSDNIQFIGCNQDIEQRVTIPVSDVEVSGDGGITLPFKKLFDLVKQANQDSVAIIDVDDKLAASLKFKGQRSKYTLRALDADSYPYILMDNETVQASFEIESASLLSAMSPVEGSMAHQDVRYFLNGMYFEKDKDSLLLVATDGHRLSMSKINDLQGDNQNATSAILPRDSQRTLNSFLKSLASDAMVNVTITNGHFIFKSNDKTFTSKLVDGRFPDYRRVIPRDNDIELAVNRNELINACRRASILANEKFRGVRLTLNGKSDAIALTSNNPEQEEASEDVVFESLDGLTGKLELGVNIDYLLNAALSLSGDIIDIQFRDENASLMIKDRVSDDTTHVVMPMRL